MQDLVLPEGYGWEMKTKSLMMYKIIHELVELFPVIQGNTNT